MSVLSMLSNLLRALSAYWELRAKRYEYDLREMSRARLEALEDELTKLRNSGTAADTFAGDRVLERLVTEKAYFKSLPSPSASPRSGD